MSYNISDNKCDCGICFESFNSKCIYTSIDCGHYFHNNCIKLWCIKCIENNIQSTCPLCRNSISNEYLDVLDIDFYSNDIIISSRAIQLFTYIISNNIHLDIKKLSKCIEKYPDEIDSVITMIRGYVMLNY